ncbi:carotenoid oxygenase family protein [Alteromonas sp. 14N.309.X.WAT.G.H12]|uniref:carotenoid oxygenase family protein n=1 Tax=Alteromonas sp. 14N.309.X.WAT.G.H12 TaxID=3120824 RepID=UPI002FD6DC52
MNRRDFVKALGLAGCGALAPSFSLKALAEPPLSFYQEFNLKIKDYPILRAWEGLTADIVPRRFTWQGKLPEALNGKTFYRNGPARVVLANQRYTHWFDGDGFVHRYAFDPKGLTHSGKFVRTKKFIEETNANRFLYNGAGSVIANSKHSKSAEAVNTANISLLPVNNELWALWEAAMPYKVDPITLATERQVSLEPVLDGMPFSAHPHADSQGHLWNFGDLSFFGQSKLIIYQLTSQGKLTRYAMVDAPQSYVHDFAVTDNYLIFYFPPITKRRGDTLISSMTWHGNNEGEMLVIDKNTLTPVLRTPFDAGFVFHFGNAWQEDNHLTINACWYKNADIMLKDVKMVTEEKMGKHDRSTAAQIRIDLTQKTAYLDNSTTPMEFVQFDSRFAAKATQIQYGVHASKHAAHGEYNSIASINTQSGKVDSYNFGDNFITEEPLFVPDGSKQGEGYLVNTGLDFVSGHTYCCVFDALHIADGPVAQVKLDSYMPLGFHGAIV